MKTEGGLMDMAGRLAVRSLDLAEANRALQIAVAERHVAEQAVRQALKTADEARAALADREADLRSVLNAVPDAMVVVDERGCIQMFSAAAERLFGFGAAEAMGRKAGMLMPASGCAPQHAAADPATAEWLTIGAGRVLAGMRRDGSTFPMELSVCELQSGKRRLLAGSARDLTERQATQQKLQTLQAELIHMSRFTAMGEMASTLAHELNQPLTAVVSYLNGCRRLIDGAETLQNLMIRDGIDRAAEQALRAGQIISRLRRFVSRRDSQRKPESVGGLIEEASALALVGVRQTGVRVACRIDCPAATVLVDKVQIEQVIVNLMRNAIEAMQDTTRRDLTIAAAAAGEDTIEVRVTDTGPGIAAGIAAHLFEPFVTTKPEGMGIGLSISRTIIEAHGGRLWAEPNPEGGAVFRLTLRTANAGGAG